MAEANRRRIANYALLTDDEIARDAINMIMPPMITADIRACGLYHDPAVCKPSEVLILYGDWTCVDWLTCPIVHKMRQQVYNVYCNPLSHVEDGLVSRAAHILGDVTRIRKDADMMLAAIIRASPAIVTARANPATRNLVGENISQAARDRADEDIRVQDVLAEIGRMCDHGFGKV